MFVARTKELARLEASLGKALNGQGQLCFVSGEPGSGKTILVREFIRLAQEEHPDLIAAWSDCNAQTGIGDPYLPFREVLSALLGDLPTGSASPVASTENRQRLRKTLVKSGQILLEVAPELIGALVPGAILAAKMGKIVADQIGLSDRIEELARHRPVSAEAASPLGEQEHIFEQFTNFVRRLAVEQPLVIVIDDLHWADASSISLLFHLPRRITSSRLLIIGTTRPTDVALGRGGERHPFDKVLPEFKRYLGDIILSLDDVDAANARSFVDAYLDSEPNHLGNDFRAAMAQRTGGNPLFTAELLRDMQDRGDLRRDREGYWTTTPSLQWDRLPAQVEGVIEERIGRLSTVLRETLACASMEGDSFAAEVVARLRVVEERDLIRRLSGELAKQHRLVEAEGVTRLGAQRLSLYRFRHMLVRKYLYDQIDVVERSQLHEDLGHILEELHADRLDDVAVQLAWHFTEAGVADKAVAYLRRAGELAAARYANAEAAGYFTRALELAPESDLATRFVLMVALDEAHDALGRARRSAQTWRCWRSWLRPRTTMPSAAR